MTTIRLMGGLGNQLFQLTAMLFLRSALGRSVRCDTSWFETAGLDGDTTRPLEIDSLLARSDRCRLPAVVARAAYSPRNPRAFREQGPGDDLLRRLPPRWVWAAGYFQRATYPIQMRDELSRRLIPVLDGMRRDDEPADVIGVHVRLGDYVTNPTTQMHHGVTGADYFAQAVRKAREEAGDLPVRVFTDSPDALGSAYGERLPRDIEISTSATSWDALHELSSCAAIVMSNSSFSWWAAFIATVLRRRPITVVMPAPWFAQKSTAEDLLRVGGWHQMRRGIGAP